MWHSESVQASLFMEDFLPPLISLFPLMLVLLMFKSAAPFKILITTAIVSSFNINNVTWIVTQLVLFF